MTGWELGALLLAWCLAGGSPGPATMTIYAIAVPAEATAFAVLVLFGAASVKILTAQAV